MKARGGGQEIDVQIGELVIDGTGAIDRAELALAVERELGRLVAGAPLQPQPATHARIDAGTLGSAAGSATPAVGRRVAEAVHRTLGGGR